MKKIIIIALSILAVTACKKSNKPTPQPTLSSRLLLSKSVYKSSVGDTANNITHLYAYSDSNKLFRDITISTYNGTIARDTADYSYNGQGYLSNVSYYQYPNASIYNITYTNGVPVSFNSIVAYKGGNVSVTYGTYKVVNGQVTEFISPNSVVNITYKNGNLASYGQSNISGSTKFTYDTKKSPFYISHFKWLLVPNQLVAGSNFNPNAILGEVATATDFSNTITYKNTYNTQGYLIKTESTSVTIGASSGGVDNPGEVLTTVYTYIDAK